MVEHHSLNLVQQEDLEADIQVFKLKEGNFLHLENESNILYVRECTRVIYDALNELRKKSNHDDNASNKAAVIGQPGIGKSFSLYYFAYRFLQEDDVDVVVLQSYEQLTFQVFHKVEVPENLSGTVDFGLREAQEVNKLLCKHAKRAVFLVDLVLATTPNIVRLAGEGFTVYESSPAPFQAHLERIKHKYNLKIFTPPPLAMNETKAIYNNLDRCLCKTDHELTFEAYFDLFGGTLKGVMHLLKEHQHVLDNSLIAYEDCIHDCQDLQVRNDLLVRQLIDLGEIPVVAGGGLYPSEGEAENLSP